MFHPAYPPAGDECLLRRMPDLVLSVLVSLSELLDSGQLPSLREAMKLWYRPYNMDHPSLRTKTQ